jgi:hypothetical protein
MMTVAEKNQYERDIQNREEAGFRAGAELSKAEGYDALFDALEAEDLDGIRFWTGEIAFWGRVARQEKDKIKKFFYGENVTDCRNNIEALHHDIIERRELRKEFSRVSGRG